jgi:hypothetical protein
MAKVRETRPGMVRAAMDELAEKMPKLVQEAIHKAMDEPPMPRLNWKTIASFPPPRHWTRHFIFWYPACSTGRTMLPARIGTEPPGSRTATHWAEVEAPSGAPESV